MIWAATDTGENCEGTPQVCISRIRVMCKGLVVLEIRPVHQYERRWVALAYQILKTAHKTRDSSRHQVTDDGLDLGGVEGFRLAM